MSFLNLSAVGKQFSDKCTKVNENPGKAKVKQKTKSEWRCRNTNLIEKSESVNWHERCSMYPNQFAKPEADNLFPLFGDR